MDSLKIGLAFEIEEKITQDKSAATIGSGGLDVYSTPSMIALMEKTSMMCVDALLEERETTVGGAVNIRHYKPTAIGKSVICKSKVVSIQGKKIDFEVEVFENEILIGNGKHTRFIVDKNLFMEKL